MSEEKLFDVNWDQRKWETPASAQDMKLYSYPPRTIRNMSVPGFLTWLVLLLAALPIIIVFLLFQKYFTKGITMGAVKG